MRAPVSDPSYNALMLLWPDAEDFPVGGEIDFVEMMDPTRQRTNVFVHYGARNQQVSGAVRIDATQWHTWAVEWSPAGITTFVDGVAWWSTTNRGVLPPRSMHLCLQLDWFPRGTTATPSVMFVDWVALYPISGVGPGRPPGSSTEPPATPTLTTTPATTTATTPATTRTASSPTPAPVTATAGPPALTVTSPPAITTTVVATTTTVATDHPATPTTIGGLATAPPTGP